jgi:hypothetical protein
MAAIKVESAMKRSCRDGLVAFVLLLGMHANATGAPNPSMATKMPMNQITIVPDRELELLGVSADHKTWEAPDGTIYRCDGGFYGIKVKGRGTVRCNGKEL